MDVYAGERESERDTWQWASIYQVVRILGLAAFSAVVVASVPRLEALHLHRLELEEARAVFLHRRRIFNTQQHHVNSQCSDS